MALDPGEIRKGDTITARWLDALRQLVAAAGRLAVQAPLAMSQSPSGRLIRLAGEGTSGLPIPARLTAVDSTSRAYSWIEMSRTAAHGWATLAGGRASGVGHFNAFEANLAIDLPVGDPGGAVVELRPARGLYDEYRFDFLRLGGSTPCTVPQSFLGSVTFSCGCSGISGTFTLKDGGTTLGTCSVSSGAVSCSIPFTRPVGTDLSWTYVDATYGTYSGSFSATCGVNGYQCFVFGTHTNPATGLIEKVNLPDTLTLTDPLGNAVTLTYDGTSHWRGSHGYLLHPVRCSAFGTPAPFDTTFTVDYDWSPCLLKATCLGHTWTQGTKCPIDGGGFPPADPTPYTPGPGPSIVCVPLLHTIPVDMDPYMWGGRLWVSDSCGCSANIFGQRLTATSGLTTCVYQLFGCVPSPFTVSL